MFLYLHAVYGRGMLYTRRYFYYSNSHSWAKANPHRTRIGSHQQEFCRVLRMIISMGRSVHLHDLQLVFTVCSLMRHCRISWSLFHLTCECICGISMTVPQYILAGMCEHISIQHLLTVGLVEVDTLSGPHVSWSLPLDIFVWGHVKSLVYGKPIDSKQYLLARITYAFDGICHRPGVFGRVGRSLE
ncbi:hypothetical protein PR048_011946 [Dryococelus australis]|uniref:Uncharacterized protein n=1 Tax=Dryococelus australis TaxID=614101 RepID=A0ABQ9HN31_9NEOP|nr:hypothetical protein PR048_011946 [Dryococelus australis]